MCLEFRTYVLISLFSSLIRSNIISLLQLLPSKGEPENVKCVLSEYIIRDLDAVNHPYEALLYACDCEKKPKSITILDDQEGDRELAVTENLHTALLLLQNSEIPRTIWVDAVCM
jgi:hypothetical protein